MTTIQPRDIQSISIGDHNRRVLVTYANGELEQVDDIGSPRHLELERLAKTWGKGYRVGRFDMTRYTRPQERPVDPNAPFYATPAPPTFDGYWERLAVAIIEHKGVWYVEWGYACHDLIAALRKLVRAKIVRECAFGGYVIRRELKG